MRIEGWESRLAEYLASAKPFQWGVNDCALWTADWIRIATGRTLTPDNCTYDSEETAAQYLDSVGYDSAADLADYHLKTVSLNFAQRGDLMLHPVGTLGICNGVFSHFLTFDGLIRFPTNNCIRAWKVD